MRRLLVIVLLSSTVAAAGAWVAPAGATPPSDDPGRGVVHRGLRPASPGGPCKTEFELVTAHGGRRGCSHGPDPAPEGIDVRVARSPREAGAEPGAPTTTGATQVPCYGDGSTGARVQLVYARASDRPDRYAELLPTFQAIAARLDAVFVQSAGETGGERHVRFVTDASCTPVVNRAVVSATGDDDIDATIGDLVAQGYNRSDRKYLVWMDANVYCGIAEVYDDDRPGLDNPNNGISAVPGMVARVDNGCWGLTNLVEAHELMHNLGGVQSTAPHATSRSHCTDDYDRMCYNDGSGEPVTVVCPASTHDALFDCNHDDYFTTARPAPTHYLATHWNTANSVFLSTSGSVSGWGYNGVGELGDGTLTDRLSAVQVPNLTGVIAVSAGLDHSLAVRADGTVWAWGANGYGQLGDGSTTTRRSPVRVPGLTGVTAVAAGAYQSLALRSDGTVWSWGFNALGQLGDGTTTDRRLPVAVSGLTNVKAVATGVFHNVALKNDGTVWTWGWNGTGQLGNGTATDRLTPIRVTSLSGMTSVSAGAYHTVASRGSDGTVWAWGWNGYGQLGEATTVDHATPTIVAGLTGVVSVSAGYLHNVALTGDGRVFAWGWNGTGQLGDGTTTDRHAAVAVRGLSGRTSAVSAGPYHSLAIAASGRVAGWGFNGLGALGDGTTTSRYVATPVRGSGTALRVSAGGYHSLSS
jgi:alpha-tubulin suppressor-like RCC1 family protein